MYVLETRNLRKTFGEGEAAVEALRGVDLGVVAGEMLAIMGRSGSGKSTLLTLLGGVDVAVDHAALLWAVRPGGCRGKALQASASMRMPGASIVQLPAGPRCSSRRRQRRPRPQPDGSLPGPGRPNAVR